MPTLADKPAAIQPQILHGDCLTSLSQLDDNSVQLIVTSPPYAMQRTNTYGGIPTDKYSEWFVKRANEFKRVLKPDGTFILNIKEHCEDGQRSRYVLRLIDALCDSGWRWTEELIWRKPNAMPGYWGNRFRDAWERLLQFNLNRKFKMRQEEVRVESAYVPNAVSATQGRLSSRNGSNFGINKAAFKFKDWKYPDNVLELALYPGDDNAKRHSAVFPKELPDWFIRLFTDEGDLVLDPFCGSGTTLVAALKLGRPSIGCEIHKEYCQVAQDRIQALQ